jgi:hypothetical protein
VPETVNDLAKAFPGRTLPDLKTSELDAWLGGINLGPTKQERCSEDAAGLRELGRKAGFLLLKLHLQLAQASPEAGSCTPGPSPYPPEIETEKKDRGRAARSEHVGKEKPANDEQRRHHCSSTSENQQPNPPRPPSSLGPKQVSAHPNQSAPAIPRNFQLLVAGRQSDVAFAIF